MVSGVKHAVPLSRKPPMMGWTNLTELTRGDDREEDDS
jgi:hypothetical protein